MAGRKVDSSVEKAKIQDADKTGIRCLCASVVQNFLVREEDMKELADPRNL